VREKNYLPLLRGAEASIADRVEKDYHIIRYDQCTHGERKTTIYCGYEDEEFYTYPPRKPIQMGLVIGTYASVPYVHLGLESWKRNYGHVPVLVHDDCSPKQTQLRDLCKQYGVSFSTNSVNRGHTVGDTSSFLAGWYWGLEKKIDLLVKFSRRFLPLYDWTAGLEKLARETQYPTFGNVCHNLHWGFRSECVAIHVPTWKRADVMDIVCKEIIWKKEMFAENFWHEMAREVHHYTSPANIAYTITHPREEWCNGYGPWEILGENRVKKVAGLIWHHSCEPGEYYAVAADWGLPYTREDFGLPEGAHD
jgi:hypothetical protein